MTNKTNKTTASTTKPDVNPGNQLMLLSADHAFEVRKAIQLFAETDNGLKVPEAALTPGFMMAENKPYRVRNSTAIIPVHGFLVHRLSWHIPNFITGYDYIEELVHLASEDDEIDRIAFDFNTPGGYVAGCAELAKVIRDIEKPTIAVCDNGAYSAGYWLACSCDRIELPETGGVGSIGVIATHVDISKMYEDYGVKVSFVYAGDYKKDGNMYEKLDEGARSRWQERIDQIYSVFVEAVAQQRGMDPEAVIETQAGIFLGQSAVDAGLADVISDPKTSLKTFYSSELDGSSSKKEDYAMSTSKDKAAANGSANNASTQTSEEPVEQPVSAAAPSDDTNQARTDERARVKAITGSEEAQGRSDLAQHLAFNTDMGADEAKAILAAAPAAVPAKPKEDGSSGNAFESAMANTPNPDISADESEDEAAANPSDAIMRDYASATNYKFQ